MQFEEAFMAYLFITQPQGSLDVRYVAFTMDGR